MDYSPQGPCVQDRYILFQNSKNSRNILIQTYLDHEIWTSSHGHGHHHMVNTKIKLIMFFATKDGKALYSQQKQDWELTVALIMSSLLQISDLN